MIACQRPSVTCEDVYSIGESERVLGKALKELGVKRDDIVIATKVNFPMSDVSWQAQI